MSELLAPLLRKRCSILIYPCEVRSSMARFTVDGDRLRSFAILLTKSMADAFNVLDKDVDKQRGLGVILCLYDEKLYLKDDLVVLPIEYL